MKKIVVTLSIVIFFPMVVFASPFEYEICNLGWKHVHHRHNEESYQQVWCNMHNGILEYENSDFTRVDCLTKKYAVEFDFADKWYESIGQALHYGLMTGKKPMLVLIIEDSSTQNVYCNRVKKIGKKYKVNVECITNDILNLNKEGKCFNPNCKCHKQN
mgnify:CR=1 FL=1